MLSSGSRDMADTGNLTQQTKWPSCYSRSTKLRRFFETWWRCTLWDCYERINKNKRFNLNDFPLVDPKATCIPWAGTNLIRYPRSLWSSSLSRLRQATYGKPLVGRGSMTLLQLLWKIQVNDYSYGCNCCKPVNFDIARYCYVVIVISIL